MLRRTMSSSIPVGVRHREPHYSNTLKLVYLNTWPRGRFFFFLLLLCSTTIEAGLRPNDSVKIKIILPICALLAVYVPSII
jgi:hypothetical protein